MSIKLVQLSHFAQRSFQQIKVTVENFDFCVAARALSSAARHVDRLVLTVEMGPWEGAQFSAPAVKRRRLSPFCFAEL